MKEIRKEKPFLPIITKSDVEDEDWSDAENKIIKTLMPKTDSVRKEQELDVQQRTKDFLLKTGAKATLLQPISISAELAKKGQLAESNIEALFSALERRVLENAIAYKLNKPKKLLSSYFKLEIIEKIDKELIPDLLDFEQQVQAQQAKLAKKERLVVKQVLADVSFHANLLVDKYKQSKNITGLTKELNGYISEKFNQQIDEVLKELFDNIKHIGIALDPNNIAGYEDVTISYTIKGRKRSLWTKIITLDFSNREKSKTKTTVVGVDANKVVESLQQDMQSQLEQETATIFSDFNLTLGKVLSVAQQMRKDIETLKEEMKHAIH